MLLLLSPIPGQAASGWSNTAFPVQTTKFTSTFYATPTQNDEDLVFGFSKAAASAYTDLATIIRFNNTGTIDIRNGNAYAAAVSVPYTAGAKYYFSMTVNISQHTYSVSVTPPGKSAILLASNYAFRSEQATVTSLANRAEYGSTAATAKITNFTVTTVASAVNGACGASNGADLTSKPSTNLCTAGTASSVSGIGPWSWSCAGTNGGTTASCSALLKTNGSCGTSNGASLSSAPTTGLCSTGTASSVTGSGPWSWSCTGSNSGTNASCSASRAATPVNGAAGSANGGNFYSLSSGSANLCSAGTVSNFTTYSNGWTWSCAGSNGGTTASGSAHLAVNGTCGIASGTSVSSAPASGLCSAGTASSVSGSGPWSWSCAGVNGGTTASCSASLATSSCPFAATAEAHGIFNDGCASAPAGSAQYPDLLSKYGGKRPYWDVAGADYHVGIPAGTVLTDWHNINNPDVTVNTSTGMIRCTGAGASVTLDKIDFSLHGGSFIYNGGGGCASVTITNSNFACPATALSFTMVQDQGNATFTVKNNNFNGANCYASNGPGGGFQAFLFLNNAVVQYNWFIHSSEQVLSISTPAASLDYRYNLLDDIEISPGAHMNYLQWGGAGSGGTPIVEFNTGYQTSCGGAEGFQFYNNNTPASITNPVVSNNTLIAVPPNPAGSCASPNNGVVMSYMIHGTAGSQFPTTINGTGTNTNNFFDTSGAYGAYYSGTMTGWTSSGNTDMNTGNTITPP
jgi:hypothetical protein